MISLTIAALTFVVGLNIYVYVSAQVRQRLPRKFQSSIHNL